MSGETSVLLLSKQISLEEIERLYQAIWEKAATIYPRLVFEKLNDYQIEMGFHFKSRSFSNIEQYKQIVRMAIQKKYPDCTVR